MLWKHQSHKLVSSKACVFKSRLVYFMLFTPTLCYLIISQFAHFLKTVCYLPVHYNGHNSYYRASTSRWTWYSLSPQETSTLSEEENLYHRLSVFRKLTGILFFVLLLFCSFGGMCSNENQDLFPFLPRWEPYVVLIKSNHLIPTLCHVVLRAVPCSPENQYPTGQHAPLLLLVDWGGIFWFDSGQGIET